ncbi:hypothetical protein PC129_g4187 [Phytophthora cactorum]|uniref:FLYWCH-type domain-containing protein n=1 Tax=Phytophthora cactorum TaxID=29920 RepID=A0A8T0Z9W4_9STRA|nr:hypothetical protein PC112_g18599 [Phytophthora cactorum]KAG2835753.1 hypothetical protein PC111_g5327 [Phytophthora cactorum]KAG2859379.1 hypothetical protein PC113_g9002 [Phytophthora cactorum]KAG2908157.1 hypothetical protein PC117_g20040 [Phytophthora cactorum]KAG2918719.1 hypothetical protein PC114_g6754 [Phytophthora cactorum]
MEYKGYNFYRQRTVEESGTSYFICAQYRGGCKARVIVRNDTVKARNDLTCEKDVKQAPTLTDVRAEMRVYLQEACLANLSHRLSLIRERVMASLREAHPDDALNTIPRLPSTSHTRAQATGSDAFRVIESVPTRNVAEDDRRPFLQFNVVHTVGCERSIWSPGPRSLAPLLKFRYLHRWHV